MSRGGYDIDAVRAAVAISDVIGRDVQWDMRKSNPAKGDYWACCPFHGEATPSFHVVERGSESFFHCFGCQAKGDVFRYVMDRDGLSFGEALRRMAEDGGVSAAFDPQAAAQREEARAARLARKREEEAKAQATAEEIWKESQADHPLLAQYLDARIGARRRAAIWDAYGAPALLRVHPALPHFSQNAGGWSSVAHTGPAMIGLVAKNRAITGVHRTWITPEGRARLRDGTKAPKQMKGPCYGGGIPLTPFAPRLIVGEGIETTLAYLGEAALSHGFDPASWAAVCALSLGALTGAQAASRPGAASTLPDYDRPGWTCPDGVDDLILLGDGSAKRPDEARRRMAIAERRHRCDAAGVAVRRCRIAWPAGAPENGMDWADWAVDSEGEGV